MFVKDSNAKMLLVDAGRYMPWRSIGFFVPHVGSGWGSCKMTAGLDSVRQVWQQYILYNNTNRMYRELESLKNIYASLSHPKEIFHNWNN